MADLDFGYKLDTILSNGDGSFYDFFYCPTIVRTLKGASYLLRQFPSFSAESVLDSPCTLSQDSFSTETIARQYQDMYENMHPRAEAITGINNYVVLSRYDYGCHLLISSIVYRACQLLATAVQHKIAQSNWHPVAKFVSSAAVLSMPVVVIFLIGAPHEEILFSFLVNTAASLFLPARGANFFREIDLVSQTRMVKFTNVVRQNFLSAIRGIAINGIVFDYFLKQFLKSRDQSSTFSTNPWTSTDLMETSEQFGVIMHKEYKSGNLHSEAGFGLPPTPTTYVTYACASLIGKLLVDGTLMLLTRKKIAGRTNSFRVTDLRRPFGPTPAKENKNIISQPDSTPTKDTLSLDIIKDKLRLAHLSDNGSSSLVGSLPTSSNNVPRQKQLTKVKTTAAKGDIVPIKKATAAPSKEREPIVIPGGSCTIFPLIEQGDSNIWGVLTCDVTGKKAQVFEPYLTSLATGHIGNQRSTIKSLGKGDKKYKDTLVYEIRPGSDGDRVLGILYRGEEAIDAALKYHFPYEIVLPLIDQMRQPKKEVKLIIFDGKVKHEKVSKNIAH